MCVLFFWQPSHLTATTARLTARIVAAAEGRVGWRVLLANLDAVCLIVDVKHALLDLLVDLLRRVDERLLHVRRGASRRFHKHQTVLPSERFALLLLDLAARIQITLVANQHDDHVRVGVLPGVLEPGRQVVERLAARNVVHEQGAGRPAVVRARDRPERLLAGRVPNLQLDLLAVDGDHPRAELDPDRQVMDRLEALVGKLEQQAGLANTCVAYDDVFEQVRVRHSGCCGWSTPLFLMGVVGQQRNRLFAQLIRNLARNYVAQSFWKTLCFGNQHFFTVTTKNTQPTIAL